MEPSLRLAGVTEADSLSSLAVETYIGAFGHSMSKADVEEHTARRLSPAEFTRILTDDFVLVAELSAQLIGFAQFGLALSDSESGAQAELRRLYVLAEYQNRSTGSRLIQAALAHPLLASADAVVLDVWKQNVAAQRFYRRYGFQAVGERAFSVASGAETTPDIIMVRVASPPSNKPSQRTCFRCADKWRGTIANLPTF
jgi:ribosomal protein S18 acetylase RimI-like enzyme